MTEGAREQIDIYFHLALVHDELCLSSVQKYKESIQRFFKTIGDKEFSELRDKDFEEFIFLSKKKGNKASGIVGVVNAMKWILKKLQEESEIEKMINLDKIKKPKIPKRDVEYLSKGEIKRFLKVIEGDISKISGVRAMALYMILLETGGRIGEILSIQVDEISFKRCEVPIIGKGNKPRVLLLQSQSVFWIKKYLEVRKSDCPYLFVTRNGASPWSHNDVNRSFLRLRKLSGIKKKFTIHSLRHTFATQLLQAGVPISNVQTMLGHSNLETTIKYYIGGLRMYEIKKSLRPAHFSFVPTVFS